MIQFHQPETLVRDWGTETILCKTPTYCMKILFYKAGHQGGLQFHLKRESHYLLAGEMRLRYHDDYEGTVMAPATWTVEPGTVHQETAVTDCKVLEVSEPLLDDRVRVDGAEEGLQTQGKEEAIQKLSAYMDALDLRVDELMRLGEVIHGGADPGSWRLEAHSAQKR